MLLLKLVMTPMLIASVTLVGRRWGPGIGGWLMGFPLTSGPVSLLLCLQYGPAFAADAAVGTLGGQAAVCIFCLAYALVARASPWPVSAALAITVFLCAVFLLNTFSLALLPAFLIGIAASGLILRLIPRRTVDVQPVRTPVWDLPARMLAAAAFVLLLTTFASWMGPQLSGLISPFPVFGVVIAAFTHHQQGAGAAAQMLRGVVLGSFAFYSFFFIVAALLPVWPAGWVYCLATLAALGANGLALRSMQRS